MSPTTRSQNNQADTKPDDQPTKHVSNTLKPTTRKYSRREQYPPCDDEAISNMQRQLNLLPNQEEQKRLVERTIDSAISDVNTALTKATTLTFIVLSAIIKPYRSNSQSAFAEADWWLNFNNDTWPSYRTRMSWALQFLKPSTNFYTKAVQHLPNIDPELILLLLGPDLVPNNMKNVWWLITYINDILTNDQHETRTQKINSLIDSATKTLRNPHQPNFKLALNEEGQLTIGKFRLPTGEIRHKPNQNTHITNQQPQNLRHPHHNTSATLIITSLLLYGERQSRWINSVDSTRRLDFRRNLFPAPNDAHKLRTRLKPQNTAKQQPAHPDKHRKHPVNQQEPNQTHARKKLCGNPPRTPIQTRSDTIPTVLPETDPPANANTSPHTTPSTTRPDNNHASTQPLLDNTTPTQHRTLSPTPPSNIKPNQNQNPLNPDINRKRSPDLQQPNQIHARKKLCENPPRTHIQTRSDKIPTLPHQTDPATNPNTSPHTTPFTTNPHNNHTSIHSLYHTTIPPHQQNLSAANSANTNPTQNCDHPYPKHSVDIQQLDNKTNQLDNIIPTTPTSSPTNIHRTPDCTQTATPRPNNTLQTNTPTPSSLKSTPSYTTTNSDSTPPTSPITSSPYQPTKTPHPRLQSNPAVKRAIELVIQSIERGTDQNSNDSTCRGNIAETINLLRTVASVVPPITRRSYMQHNTTRTFQNTVKTWSRYEMLKYQLQHKKATTTSPPNLVPTTVALSDVQKKVPAEYTDLLPTDVTLHPNQLFTAHSYGDFYVHALATRISAQSIDKPVQTTLTTKHHVQRWKTYGRGLHVTVEAHDEEPREPQQLPALAIIVVQPRIPTGHGILSALTTLEHSSTHDDIHHHITTMTITLLNHGQCAEIPCGTIATIVALSDTIRTDYRTWHGDNPQSALTLWNQQLHQSNEQEAILLGMAHDWITAFDPTATTKSNTTDPTNDMPCSPLHQSAPETNAAMQIELP